MQKMILFILAFFLCGPNLDARDNKKFNINEYYAEENFKKGVFYYNDTKFLSAAEFFIKSLQYDPEFFRAKAWLGNTYYKAGYVENAIDEWQDVVDQGGADNILIQHLNNIYYQLGNSKKVSRVNSYVHLKTIDGNKWDDRRFLRPMSIFINYNQEAFLTGLASKSVLHFDPNFNLIKGIKKGKKSLKMPFGFAMDSKDNIYISDVKRDIIQKFDKKGKFIDLIGGKGDENGQFLGPEAMCVDSKDDIYVVDTGNCRIQKFSSDGKFLMKFGQRGEYPGEFFKPTGVTIDKKNNLYISDHIKSNIQKFDPDGNFLELIFEDKSFNDIRNIRYYEDYFLVADGVNGGYIYDKNMGTWVNIKRFNFSQDKLLSVSDLCFDKDGSLYILDFYKNTIEIFVSETYKYANLDLQIDVVDISQYPRMVLYCSVKKKDGTPVTGLSAENFVVKELGHQVTAYDTLDTIYDENKISALFLIEKSFEMKKYENDVKEAASYFLKDIFNTKDVVKVFNFHKKNWAGLEYEYKKLRILEALTENDYHYVTDVSKPLYKSITDVMNRLSRKAIIFFTTGDFDVNKNFKVHEYEVCKNYARINHVPIFVINFTRNNENKLKELARTTYGKYYYYFNDVKKLKNIRKDILKVPLNQYIIVYETIRNRNLINMWREIDLEVDFHKLTGIDKTGYFVPNH